MKKAVPWIIIIVIGIIALYFLLGVLRTGVTTITKTQRQLRQNSYDTSLILDPNVQSVESTSNVATCNGIRVDWPIVNEQVILPIDVQATIHPNGVTPAWPVFEGQAGTVRVRTSNQYLSPAYPLTIQGDWMTNAPKMASASITQFAVTPPTGAELFVEFTADTTSGQGTPATCTIPVSWAG